MSDTTRLFIALPVPDDFRALIAALPRKGLEARWSHPDDLHITIRFLGDVADSRLTAVREALGRVRRPPFHVDVRGLDLFDNKNQAVLHAAVESTRKLTTLCADITDVLTPLGFDFGMRPFVPHITLARVKRRSGLDAYIKRQGEGIAGHWQADSFALMRSATPGNPAERHYAILDSYPLK